MEETVISLAELATLWDSATWPSRLAMAAPLWVTASSVVSAVLPDHLSDKGRDRIDKLLRGLRKTADISALNVGKAKNRKTFTDRIDEDSQ